MCGLVSRSDSCSVAFYDKFGIGALTSHDVIFLTASGSYVGTAVTEYIITTVR